MSGLILASGSPRRHELLATFGLPFEIVVPDVDETPLPGEDPAAYVARLAEAKARAVDGALVLAADTTVVVDGAIIGKPEDPDDHARMIRRLSGRTHEVLTGVALHGRQLQVAVERSSVSFVELTESEVAWYVGTGEGTDKAGGYAVQGQGAIFVERVEGSVSNIVGLPLHRVRAMLATELH
ncbi:MAG: Maf family protein [Acidimicrobiales bacterium]|jgi:septum formation protein|nr:Maf family protein [Acidimicrobiales bacterium]